jgi:hypothetical protein
VTDRVDHEVEVVKRERFAVVSMFLENNCKSFKRQDGFQQMEVLAEKEVGLHVHFVLPHLREDGLFLHRTEVGMCVEIVYLCETGLHLLLVQHY